MFLQNPKKQEYANDFVVMTIAKCAACGASLELSESLIRCKHCGGTLCSDCGDVAVKSNRCPACGGPHTK
jgi:hypothetical protein